MARLQVRFFCHNTWDDWEDCDPASAVVHQDDLREGEAWHYRVVEDDPIEPELQTRVLDPTGDTLIAWHDVVFVDGVLRFFEAPSNTREIRVKPPFQPGYYRCTKAHAGYSVSVVKWWETRPMAKHWEAVRVLPRNA